MAFPRGMFDRVRGFDEDEGEENGVFRCQEDANTKIRLTPKRNDQEVRMAEALLQLVPLGLELDTSNQLAYTIQKHIHHANFQAGNAQAKDDQEQMAEKEKLKASNFSVTLLRIGSWERVSRYEGDLVAKFYFSKRKLVWEVLENGLKSKIEFSWNDILAIRADIRTDWPGILELEISKPPAFFCETDPRPRKHTVWRPTTDFTCGEASNWRKHFLICPSGSLDKHYEKLLQCDDRLLAISRQDFPSNNNPTFEVPKPLSGLSFGFNDGGLHMSRPGMYSPFQSLHQPYFAQNQPMYHDQPLVAPSTMSFRGITSLVSDELRGGNNVFENSRMAYGDNAYQGQQSGAYLYRRLYQNFEMNQVQGMGSTVLMNDVFSYANDQGAGSSHEVEVPGGVQEQVLINTPQVGVSDNNYNVAGEATLRASVRLAGEDKGDCTSNLSEHGFHVDDFFEEDNLDFSTGVNDHLPQPN